jgi:hypothetical protein
LVRSGVAENGLRNCDDIEDRRFVRGDDFLSGKRIEWLLNARKVGGG